MKLIKREFYKLNYGARFDVYDNEWHTECHIHGLSSEDVRVEISYFVDEDGKEYQMVEAYFNIEYVISLYNVHHVNMHGDYVKLENRFEGWNWK